MLLPAERGRQSSGAVVPPCSVPIPVSRCPVPAPWSPWGCTQRDWWHSALVLPLNPRWPGEQSDGARGVTAARERGWSASGPTGPAAPLGILDAPSGRHWEPSTQPSSRSVCWCLERSAEAGLSPSRRFATARCVLPARGLRVGVSEDAKRAGRSGRRARRRQEHGLAQA